MSWWRILAAVVAIVAAIVDALKKNGVIAGARAEIIAAHLQGVRHEIEEARLERARVRDDLTAHPERVREPDKFQRKE